MKKDDAQHFKIPLSGHVWPSVGELMVEMALRTMAGQLIIFNRVHEGEIEFEEKILVEFERVLKSIS